MNLRFFGYWFDEKLYGSIDIVGVQADIGPKLKATATVHDTEPKLCTNLDLYFVKILIVLMNLIHIF